MTNLTEFLRRLTWVVEKMSAKNQYPIFSTLSFPLNIFWEISDRCNLKCEHCYHDLRQGELPFNEVIEIGNEILRNKPFYVYLTGGEPFFMDNFLMVLRSLVHSSTGTKFILTTNGTLLDDCIIQFLSNMKDRISIMLSIDGDRATHDRLRGQGVFDKAALSYEKLSMHRINVYIHSVFNKYNIKSVETFPTILESLGTRKWAVDILAPTNSRNRKLAINKKEIASLLSIISQLRGDWKVALGDRLRIAQRVLEYNKGGTQPIGCPACRYQLCVTPIGDVTPCVFYPLKLGNCLETSLQEIVKGNLYQSVKNVASDSVSGRCRECTHLHICEGGCRGLSYIYTRSICDSDPTCPFFEPRTESSLEQKSSQLP